MRETIAAYILTRLSRAASDDEIIYSVCQKTGIGWDDAKALVEQVRDENLTEIEARQTPLKSLLSFVFFIMGIVLTFGPMVYLWIMLDVTSTFLVFVSSGFGADATNALKLLGSRCVLLSWFELPSIIFTMLAGIAIIIANLRSMRGAWEALFRKWKVNG